MLGVILRLLGTICSFLSSWIKLKLSPCGFSMSSEGSCFLILDEIGSCNEITTALTLFLPGEGGISPLIVYHVTKSVRNRVN